MSLVYIVILTWNSAADIVECLTSVRALQYTNYRVVVVDNASTDDTAALVREKFPEVHVIENAINLGYAAGNNVGLDYALANQADYILLLNDDTVVAADAVVRLVELAEADPQIGMLGSSIVSYYDRSKEYLGARVDWSTGLTFQIPYSPSRMGEADHVAGCALLVKASVIRQIGLLDPAYFCYFEDTDWGIRCRKAGYHVATVFASKVYHKGTPDNIKHISQTLLYYYRRNQYYFMYKHAPRHLFLRFYPNYVLQCLSQATSLIRLAKDEHAHALIDGFWAGITHQYGAQQVTAPNWFKRPIWVMLSVLGRVRYGLVSRWRQVIFKDE